MSRPTDSREGVRFAAESFSQRHGRSPALPSFRAELPVEHE